MNCPDCGGEVSEEEKMLSDEEYTSALNCTECSWGIETNSNLVREY